VASKKKFVELSHWENGSKSTSFSLAVILHCNIPSLGQQALRQPVLNFQMAEGEGKKYVSCRQNQRIKDEQTNCRTHNNYLLQM